MTGLGKKLETRATNDKPTKFDDGKERLLKAAYQFEYGVILILIASVGIITLLALICLFFGIYDAIVVNWDPKNLQTVQLLFGMIMTVVIALEFGNSILRHIREHEIIIQAREVILIGMMAVVRKVMIIDLSVVPPLQIGALAALAIALAGAYWFMREE